MMKFKYGLLLILFTIYSNLAFSGGTKPKSYSDISKYIDNPMLIEHLKNNSKQRFELIESNQAINDKDRVKETLEASLNCLEKFSTSLHQNENIPIKNNNYLTLAKEGFKWATAEINGTYGYDENAAKARSLWYSTTERRFLGDAYERSMAFYYLGVIYMLYGDYEKARATFKAGTIQDEIPGVFEEVNVDGEIKTREMINKGKSDTNALNLMAALASIKHHHTKKNNNSLAIANEYFGKIVTHKSKLKAFINSIKKIVLENPNFKIVIIETGYGPRKLGDGLYFNELIYKRGKNNIINRVAINDESIPIIESLYYQAKSTGFKEIDRIVNGKVKYREKSKLVSSYIGKAATITHMATIFGSSDSTGLGSVLVLGGVAMDIATANVNTRVDDRYWINLPNKIRIAVLKENEPNIKLRVSYKKRANKRRNTFEYESKSNLSWIRLYD